MTVKRQEVVPNIEQDQRSFPHLRRAYQIDSRVTSLPLDRYLTLNLMWTPQTNQKPQKRLFTFYLYIKNIPTLLDVL